MTTPLLAVPLFRAFDTAGDPLASGKLYAYAANTTTPKDTYSDSAGATPNANPVILDSTGSATVRLGSGGYKFVLKDSSDVTQWTVDNVYGDYIDAATIGALLYPQTGAESTVTVTPSDYTEPPGDAERYGAANGSNSSTALQASVDQGEQSTGAPIFIPYGRFVINSALDVDNTVSVYGQGYYSQLQLTNAGTHRVALIEHPSFTAINGVRLRDFRVDGNSGGTYDSGIIQFNNGVGFVVDGLWIENASRASGASGINGIAFSYGTVGGTAPSGTLLNCYFTGMSKGAINCSTGCDGVTAAFNISKLNTGNGVTPGLQSFDSTRTKFIGNIAGGNQGRGIFVNANSTIGANGYGLVALNHTYGNGTGSSEGDGIAVTNTHASAQHMRVMLTDNFVVDNGDGLTSGGSGVAVVNAKSVDVRGQWIYDNALHGVLLSSQSLTGGHIRVVDNIIDANNTKGNAAGSGVYVIGTFDTLEISRNKISNPDAASRHRYGIYIDDTSVINDLVIRDNQITEMVTQEYYLGSGGATITRFDIRLDGRRQTTDGSNVTVFSVRLPDDSACYVKASAVGVKSDGTDRAAYERAAVVYRDGGGATIQSGSQTSLFSQESAAGWDASIGVSGNLITFVVTGAAATTVNWRWKVEAYSI